MSRYTKKELKERAAAAQRDRERLAAGWKPGKAEKDSAGVINDWQIIDTPEGKRLEGFCAGFPYGMGVPVRTSTLIAVDIAGGWARSQGRWWILGRPSTPVVNLKDGRQLSVSDIRTSDGFSRKPPPSPDELSADPDPGPGDDDPEDPSIVDFWRR